MTRVVLPTASAERRSVLVSLAVIIGSAVLLAVQVVLHPGGVISVLIGVAQFVLFAALLSPAIFPRTK